MRQNHAMSLPHPLPLLMTNGTKLLGILKSFPGSRPQLTTRSVFRADLRNRKKKIAANELEGLCG